MSRPDKYNDIMLLCVIIGLYLRKVNPASFFLVSISLVPHREHVLFLSQLVSYLLPQKLTGEKKKEKNNRKIKQG